VSDRHGGWGCLLLICLAVLVVVAIILQILQQLIFGPEGAAHDDPYFHRGECSVPIGTLEPEPVDITGAGMSYHCVVSYDLPVSFTNRFTGRSVTLCLGQAGDCVTGHVSPFPGGRLTLRPGEQKEISFRSGSWYGFGFDREYPVTVAASPGIPPSPAFDVVIDAKAGSPPDGGP
jgi:hypothetical protein